MGAAGAAHILGACDWAGAFSDFNRYVLNSCHFRSSCSDCCFVSIDTDEVALPSGSDEELEAEGCCRYSHTG